MQSAELRRRVLIGLNKGEARNTLARAVFFNRLGEMRDRTYEDQLHRASGLTLATALIVLWNTVYLAEAIPALRAKGIEITDQQIAHISPLGWEHISLTGDYIWAGQASLPMHGLRPLRVLAPPRPAPKPKQKQPPPPDAEIVIK